MSAHFVVLSRHVSLAPITSPESYDRAVAAMNALINQGAGDEAHPLAGLLDILGGIVAAYDETYHPISPGSPIGALQFQMDQHGLRQGDLRAEIDSQGVVSEILNEKRNLNVNQIVRLAARFSVSPAVFIAGNTPLSDLRNG